MKKITESAAFVINNCDFVNSNNFKQELSASDTVKEHGEVRNINIQTNFVLPPDFPMPLAAVQVGDARIIYLDTDKRVNIETVDYAKNELLLKDLLFSISNMRLPVITAIGLNYTARYNTGTKRLNMFNSSIHEKFPDWENNTGFEVVLPIDLQERLNCQAMYKISKIAGGGSSEEDFSEYVYEIFANYHFVIDIDKARIALRLSLLEEIIGKIDLLHNDFDVKCKEIIEL